MLRSKSRLLLAAVALAAASAVTVPSTVAAQTTGSNFVADLAGNVTNAQNTMSPLAISATILFIAVGAGIAFWKRLFKR